MVEGQWVFGGICRESKECFVVPVNSRDKGTLLPIIQDRILPGTCVMSDLWRAYDCLNDEGFQHLTVNRSLNFVDPDAGAHTQNIENTWWVAKRSLPQTGTDLEICLKTICWNSCGVVTTGHMTAFRFLCSWSTLQKLIG